jgi:hypothetical protein
MATTFTKIADYTVGSGGAASIDFTSIPSTYTDLVLKVSLRAETSGIDAAKVTFNSSSSGYSYRSIWSSGSGTPASYNGSSDGFFQLQYSGGTSSTGSTFTSGEMYIPNYAGSTNKSASLDQVQENNATTAYMVPMALLWSNTAAITSITIAQSNGNLAQYSTATLYGVKNA